MRWKHGAVAGLVAGVPFGLMIQFVIGAMPNVAALYGLQGIVAGWVVHLVQAAVFGSIFGELSRLVDLQPYVRTWP